MTPPSGAVSTAPSSAATSTVTSPAVGPAGAIPVYYVADVGTGPRLYREFHSPPVLNGKLRGAGRYDNGRDSSLQLWDTKTLTLR